jgi:cysteine desulfurase family protein
MKSNSIVYFDNAATTWPKPGGMVEAMNAYYQNIGANPGRSGHRLSIEASRIVYQTRQSIASLFNAPDPLSVVFCFNATDALNMSLYGLLREGDHVITSSMEHNSLMRPLRHLEKNGVELDIVKCDEQGFLDVKQIEKSIKQNTVMVALTHGSNVTGSLLPIAEVGRMVRDHDLTFLVDAAQTAGAIPVDVQQQLIDLLCFTGHKSLYGPMGTGGVVISERIRSKVFKPLRQGGTGSNSEQEIQPDFLPDMLESGTLNVGGLAGLHHTVQWVLSKGLKTIRNHEKDLTRKLIDGLKMIPNIRIYGPQDVDSQTATVAFNILNRQPSEVGFLLDEQFNIMCRVGLHCAPTAHKTIHTFPHGTVRFGLGYFNTSAEINCALEALDEIARRRV